LPSDGPTAFISYSREDSAFVLRMARDLKAAGARVWMDQLDIVPGQRWARALQDAITNSPRFLVILSPHSVASTNVEDEVAFALEEHKTIIPVLYCDCKVPFQLRPFQYADFRSDYEQGLKILLMTLGVDLPDHAVAAEKARQEELAREAAEGVRLAQEQKAAAEEARLEAERKAAAEQARLEKERNAAAERARKAEEAKAAAAAAEQARLEQERKVAERKRGEEKARKAAEEQARLDEERKAAETKAQKEAEAKAAAEQARFERERKAAKERARKEAEAKAAASGEAPLAAEERRGAYAARSATVASAGAATESEKDAGWSLGKKIGGFVSAGLLAMVVYHFLFSGSSKPAEQTDRPGRVKEIQIKPRQEESKTSAVDDGRMPSSPESTPADKQPTSVSSDTLATPATGKAAIKAANSDVMEQLLGDHRLSLQWISWDVFGKATVTDENGKLLIKGSQKLGDQYMTIDGTITAVEPRSFLFHGTIVTKANDINKGNLCTRQGTMKFAITGARRYWRLQQMDNPCDQVTDYVDIYMR
jgi:hypothetical protein